MPFVEHCRTNWILDSPAEAATIPNQRQPETPSVPNAASNSAMTGERD